METNRNGQGGDNGNENDSFFVNAFFLPGGILDPQQVDDDDEDDVAGSSLSLETTTAMTLPFPPAAPASSSAHAALPRLAPPASSPPPMLMESSEIFMPWNAIEQGGGGGGGGGGSPHSSLRSTSPFDATHSRNASFSAAGLIPVESMTDAAPTSSSFDHSYEHQQQLLQGLNPWAVHGRPNNATTPPLQSTPPPLSSSSPAALSLPPPPGFNNHLMMSPSVESFDSLLLVQNNQRPSSSLLSAAPQPQQQKVPASPMMSVHASDASPFQSPTDSMFASSAMPINIPSNAAIFRSTLPVEQLQNQSRRRLMHPHPPPAAVAAAAQKNPTINQHRRAYSAVASGSFESGNQGGSSFGSSCASPPSQHSSTNNNTSNKSNNNSKNKNKAKTTTACRFFAKGYCRNGKSCKFAHHEVGVANTGISLQQPQRRHRRHYSDTEPSSMGQQSSSSTSLGNTSNNNVLHHDDNAASSTFFTFPFYQDQRDEQTSYASITPSRQFAHHGLQQNATVHQNEKDEKTASIAFLARALDPNNEQYAVGDAPPESPSGDQEETRKVSPYGKNASIAASFSSTAYVHRGAPPSLHSGHQQDGDGFSIASSKGTSRLDAPELSATETVRVANGDFFIPETSTDSSESDKQRLTHSPVPSLPCDSTADMSSVRPIDPVVQLHRTGSIASGQKVVTNGSSPSPSVPTSTASNGRTTLQSVVSVTKRIIPEDVRAAWEATLALTLNFLEGIFGACRWLVRFCCRSLSNSLHFIGSVPLVLHVLPLGLCSMCLYALEEACIDLDQQQQNQQAGNGENHKRPALFFYYSVMGSTPILCGGLMEGLFSIRCLFLPQWAPHVISNLVIYLLCRDTGKDNIQKREMTTADICIQFLRRHVPLFFVVACFLMDGFGEANSGIMLLPLPKRLIFTYMLVIVHRGLLLSPVAWVSLALQVLLVYYFSCPWFYSTSTARIPVVSPTWAWFKETCIVLLLSILGLASIRLVGILEKTTQTMQTMEQRQQQQQESSTSTSTKRQGVSRKTGR